MPAEAMVREIKFSVGETSDLGLSEHFSECESCKGVVTPEYSVWDMDAHVSAFVGTCEDCHETHAFFMHDGFLMTNSPQMFADFVLSTLDAPYEVLREWVITDL